MKALITLLLMSCAVAAWSQSIEELEQQLSQAENSKDKMHLALKLGESYLRSDADKALEYGKQSHNLATQLKQNAMAARSAFLVAQAYERKNDDRNVEVWMRSAQNFAMKAGDSDLIIRSVDRRSRLAEKVRNYRRAYEINQEAFAFFSNKGTSISDLESKYETQKLQIEKEKKELEKERDKLAFEVANLEVERDQLTTDKSSLEQRQEQLVREKQKVEQEISTKEEKLAEVSTEKEKAVEIIRKKEEEVKDLTREALEQRTVLAETELDLKETQLVAEQNRNLRNLTFFAAGFILVLAMLFYGRFRSNKKANKILAGKNAIIENERKRSDELLLNILPATIAGELKEFGKARAHRYEEVTVLFSDFRNFTAIAEKLSPEELVEELDKCFKAFDFIISQYEDIEKIKTIGDAYMCASGLTNQQTYPDNIVRAAIEMQEFLHEQKQERMRLGKPFFEARIGIHTGPAVAGVVGVKKFAYDIWGDTVNIASRMEIHCEPGRVNISEVTYNKVSYKFECEYRGKVEAKNKGAIDMYYVIKERAAIAV
ncbi:MAG: hypothetical protein HUU34_06675 [Saprospiraceae bacterium]|nr:hypothetical protein [Saprospiraceae bacterium]